MNKTLYWYDFESGGANPRTDRPSQFAGLRTDEDLNIIGEPLVEYCQLSPDYLPHPQACLITGITPQKQLRSGLPEYEFARLIHQQLAEPGTTVVGYNNIRFDDEMTRFMLYRNFYDPYAWSWQNQNSRWDLVDLVRACYALRPEGIEWPNVDGQVSFKLEQLSIANQIEHAQAHDAMSDVYATIGMAKVIKQAHPRLYDFYYSRRRKATVQQMLDEAMVQAKPLVHVSSTYGTKQGNLSWIIPLGHHPQQANAVIAWRLDQDPAQWLDTDSDTLRALLYTPKQDLLEQGQQRPGLLTITTNKCPFIAPLNTLSQERAEYFGLSWAQAQQHLQALQQQPALRERLLQVFATSSEQPQSAPEDVDLALYSGPFFSEQAKSQMTMIRDSSPEQLATMNLAWDDDRLAEMLFRYRARNFPHTLTHSEQLRWRQFCHQRLTEGSQHHLSLDEFILQLEQLAHEQQQNQRNMTVIQSLAEYIQNL
ncbi:MAG: exodeoxyribonuclease I [Idiomarina sp.]|nr:exodeoxyribonuclease I [Idiomarina sp.]